jgi:hypothetical protein
VAVIEAARTGPREVGLSGQRDDLIADARPKSTRSWRLAAMRSFRSRSYCDNSASVDADPSTGSVSVPDESRGADDGLMIPRKAKKEKCDSRMQVNLLKNVSIK